MESEQLLYLASFNSVQMKVDGQIRMKQLYRPSDEYVCSKVKRWRNAKANFRRCLEVQDDWIHEIEVHPSLYLFSAPNMRRCVRNCKENIVTAAFMYFLNCCTYLHVSVKVNSGVHWRIFKMKWAMHLPLDKYRSGITDKLVTASGLVKYS